MIDLVPLRFLRLEQASHKDRHLHFSAASGLVQVGNNLYVVADDEKHLAKFSIEHQQDGILLRLFEGDLPLTYEERKAEKPDIEVLTLIPKSKKFPQGALLAMGSGSKEKRKRGAILSLDAQGNIDEISIIDLNIFYDQLKAKIGKLNIEGAVITNNDLILFQRGNKKNKINAAIRLALEDFYKIGVDAEDYKLDIHITHYHLGDINNIPLCFTDATSLPNGDIVFTAAAENTSNAYDDGMCPGSAIGVISRTGELHSIERTNYPVKLEGVAANVEGKDIHLLLVTDADDAAIPAQLYSATLAHYSYEP